jgi:hypothetical protein
MYHLLKNGINENIQINKKELQNHCRKNSIPRNSKYFIKVKNDIYQDGKVSSGKYEFDFVINPSVSPGHKTQSPQVPNEQATPSFRETSISFEEDNNSQSKKSNESIINPEKLSPQISDRYVPFHNTDSFRYISLVPLPKTIFVFNMPEIFDEHVIRQIFAPYGKITMYV